MLTNFLLRRRVICLFAGLLLAAPLMGIAAEPTRPALDGDLRQGGLVTGRVAPGAEVFQDGQAVRVGPGGEFLLGFDRDAPVSSRLEVRYPDGSVFRDTLEIASRDYRIQRIDGLPTRKVTPRSKEDLARIRADAVAVRKARDRDDERLDFRGGFIWPATGRISGVYGSQRVLNGKPRRPHYGVDVAAPLLCKFKP